MKALITLAIAVLALSGLPATAQDAKPESRILIPNVRVFDGVSDALSDANNILMETFEIDILEPGL